MCDHDERLALVGEAADFEVEALGRRAVEVARGLVGEDEAGAVHERARDGDALLLAAGELRRAVAEPLAEPELFEQRSRPRLRLAAERLPADHGRHRDVLQRRELRQQVVELEDEADLLVAELREPVVRLREHVAAAVFYASGGGPVERAEQVEQRALARAALPDDRHHLALAHRERHAAQHLQLARLGLVRLAQPVGREQRGGVGAWESGRCGRLLHKLGVVGRWRRWI